jgi:hypothetical protein
VTRTVPLRLRYGSVSPTEPPAATGCLLLEAGDAEKKRRPAVGSVRGRETRAQRREPLRGWPQEFVTWKT